MTTKTQRDPYRATLHRDGTVTYWSVYQQVWVRSDRLSDRELAARGPEERERIERHLLRDRADA
jgi:hypothetical protein